MTRYKLVLTLLQAIFFGLFISGCNSTSSVASDIILQESVPSTYTVRETYFLSNCNGDSALQQTIQKTAVIDVIQANASITQSQQESIRNSLASRYASQSVVLSLVVPHNASMEYDVLWTISKMEVVAKPNDDTSAGITYEVSIPISGGILYDVDYGCESSSQYTQPESNWGTQYSANLKLLNSQTVVTNGVALYSADLSIMPTEIGQFSVMYPEAISMGSSATITLSIDVAQEFAYLPKMIPPGIQESQYALQIDNDLYLYPVFSAKLNAINFSLDSDGYPEKALLPRNTVEWTWTITPQNVGKQSVVLQISAPIVYAQGQENVLITKVPFTIPVEEKPISKAETLKFIVVPVFVALVTSAVALFVKRGKSGS